MTDDSHVPSPFGVGASLYGHCVAEGIMMGIKEAWKQETLKAIRSDPMLLDVRFQNLVKFNRKTFRACYLVTISPPPGVVTEIDEFLDKAIEFVARKPFQDTYVISLEKLHEHPHLHIVVPYAYRSPNEVHIWASSTFKKWYRGEHSLDVSTHDTWDSAVKYVTKESASIVKKSKNIENILLEERNRLVLVKAKKKCLSRGGIRRSARKGKRRSRRRLNP